MLRSCFCLIIALVLSGCPAIPAATDLVQTTGNAIAQNQAYTTAAKNDVKSAKPHADEVGKAHLSSATTNLDNALDKSDEAQRQLAEEQKAKAAIAKQRDDEQRERLALQNSWGHKAQVWITRFLILIAIAAALHFIGGWVAVFLPGPIGAGLSLVSLLVWPPAWNQAARDNVFFRRKSNVPISPQ